MALFGSGIRISNSVHSLKPRQMRLKRQKQLTLRTSFYQRFSNFVVVGIELLARAGEQDLAILGPGLTYSPSVLMKEKHTARDSRIQLSRKYF